jgi:hypothetical protein
MKIFGTIRNKMPIPKSMYKDKRVCKTFYGTEPIGEQAKRFNWIHGVFKYKVFVPLIILCKKVLGKHLVTKIPDEPHYRYLKAFEDVFDKSVVEWHNTYVNDFKKKNKNREESEKLYKEGKGHCLYIPKAMKELVNTVCMNDDAYAEFIPFFMWNVYFQMQDMVKDGTKFHLMRSVAAEMNDVEEMHYITLHKLIEEGKLKFNIEYAGKQEKNVKR